jgi:5'-3' exoribonuclease 1
LYLNILREYLSFEYQPLEKTMKKLTYNLNSIVDDLICLLFFIGNDFLPRIYCFDIRSENLEKLLKVFYEYYENATSYINHQGTLNIQAMNDILSQIVTLETSFMTDRAHEKEANHEETPTVETKKDAAFLESLCEFYTKDK